MVLRYIFFILAFWATSLVPLTATIAANEIKSSSQDALVIAVLSNYPPFTQKDINGHPAGMFVDIWKLWSKKAGHEVTFRISDWAGTIAALKNGDADIHAGLYYSETRDQWMDYSRAFYVNGNSFYHRIDDTTPPLSFDLKGVKIGVVKGYLQETFLKGAYPKAIVVARADDVELIKELAAGKIDLFLSEDPTVESLLTQTGMLGQISSVGAPVLTNELYASVLRGRTDLLEEINSGFEQITPQEWAEIEARWVKDPAKRFFGRDGSKVVELTTQEKAWIAANPVIRTIALKDWPPVDFQGVRGEHTGIAADILDLAASRVGLKVKPQFGPWPEMLSKLQQGQIDLAPEIYYTEERAKVLVYSRPFLPLHNAIFINRQEKNIKELADLTGRNVAVEKGYAMEGFFKSAYPSINTVVVNSTLEALKLVSIGKADAYVGSQYVASYLIYQNLLHGVKAIAHVGDTPQFLHMAVPKGRKILRDIMDKALGSISEKEKRTIINRYVSTSLSPAEGKTVTATIDLTAEEKRFLSKHPTIRVHNETEWAPYNFFAQGRPQGFSIDFMRLLANKIGINVEFISGPNWSEFIDMVKEKKLDVMLNIAKSPEREKFLSFTNSYFDLVQALFIRDDMESILSIEELSGKRFAIPKGFYFEETIKKYPEVKPIVVKDTAASIQAVAFDKADALLDLIPVVEYYKRQLGITNVKLGGTLGLDEGNPIPIFIGVRKDWPELASIFSKAMKAISDTELLSVQNKWLSWAEAKKKQTKIELTEKEQAYIKAYPKLRFGIDIAWPPFEFLDKDGKYSGISSGVTELVAKISGFKLEPEKGLAWSEVTESLRSGELKMISMIQPTPERVEYLDFTEPYISYPSVILTRDNAPFITGLSGLSGVRTGVEKGYSIEEYIRTKYPAVELVLRRDSEIVLKELSAGKTEAAVMNLAVATYIIDKLKLDNIKIATPTEFTIDLAFGVQKGETVLRDILQKSLNAISEDEMTAIKNRWVALRVNFGLSLRTILIWAVPIGISLVLIMLFVVTWNRRLSVEVTERKKKEKLIALGARITQSLTLGDTLKETLQSITEIFIKDLNVAFARIWIVDETENKLILQASSGLYTHIEGDHQTLPIRGDSKISRVVFEQRPYTSNNIQDSLYVKDKSWAREQGLTSVAGIPMVVEGRSVGALVVFSREAIPEDAIHTILSVADSIAVAIERNRAEETVRESEQNYRLLVGNLPSVIYRGFADWSVEFYDNKIELLAGYNMHEFHSGELKWSALIVDEDSEAVKESFTEALKTDKSYIREYRIKTKAGDILWIQDRGHITCDDSGKIEYVDGVFFDIAERKRLESDLLKAKMEAEQNAEQLNKYSIELEEQKALLQSVFDSIPDLIFSKNLEGTYIVSNFAFERFVGLKREQIVGKNDHEMFPKNVADEFRYHDTEMIKHGKAKRNKEWVGYPDGSRVLLDTLKTPFYSNDKKLLGLLGISRNITQLHEQQVELEKARDKAEEATKAKGDFLANMSHEIRTPMNAIMGMTHLALNTDLTPKQQDYITKTNTSAQSLLGIINDILDFSKIEAGKLDMESVNFHLEDVFDNLDNLVGLKAEEKGLKLLFEANKEAPTGLVGDPLRLGQILINLVNNAVKFTDTGQIVVGVSPVEVTDEKAELQFSVQDSGIGLTEEQRGKLFQAFSQADTSTSRKYGGTGLGLTISKKLTEMMYGKIWVESEPGVGSTFIFTAVFGRHFDKKRTVADKGKDIETLKEIRGARILLVEDNEINQQVAREILEGAGLVVTIANDGREGVDAVQSREYDAVLMDIQMPVMDGYQATREIRKDPAFDKLPIIAMTASAMTQDKENASEAGMNDHVSKPIDTNELFSTLLKWIEPGERELPEHLAPKIEEKTEEKPLTDMPGISVKEGLARVGGNINLYRKILTKFFNDYADSTEQIKDALDKDDQELAQRLAHTVKGVAGNIGAKDLSGPAGELEAAIKNQKTDGIEELLDGFKDALNVVINSLKNVVEVEDRAEKEKTAGQIEEPKKLFELLQKLEPHLKKRKPKPCKEVMGEINGFSWPNEYTQDIAELGKLIGKYKFKDAQPILESIMGKLKES